MLWRATLRSIIITLFKYFIITRYVTWRNKPVEWQLVTLGIENTSYSCRIRPPVLRRRHRPYLPLPRPPSCLFAWRSHIPNRDNAKWPNFQLWSDIRLNWNTNTIVLESNNISKLTVLHIQYHENLSYNNYGLSGHWNKFTISTSPSRDILN